MSIGQDKKETVVCTHFPMCLKSNKGVNHSTPLFNHGSGRKDKAFHGFFSRANRLGQSDCWECCDKFDPLGYSFVKSLVNSLQLCYLLSSEAELGDQDKALRVTQCLAKILGSLNGGPILEQVSEITN